MSGQDLERVLGGLPEHPRVVASGNFAMPTTLLGLVDAALPSYTLHVLNAQRGLPTRPGVVHETSFVGPGMRDSAALRYVPARLSLLPELSGPRWLRTWSSCTRRCRRTTARCRWAPRSTCCPPRSRRYVDGVAGCWPRSTRRCPTPAGTRCCRWRRLTPSWRSTCRSAARHPPSPTTPPG